MKCEKCGEELPEFAKFCLFCGSAVSEEESDEAESVDAEKDVDVEAEDPGAEDVTEGDLEDAAESAEPEASDGDEEPASEEETTGEGDVEDTAAEDVAEEADDPEKAEEADADESAAEPADPDKTVAVEQADHEEIPAPKKLEEPLEPMGIGAVPLVPVAPPPRATRIRPRAPRPYVSRDAHAGSRSGIRMAVPVAEHAAPQSPAPDEAAQAQAQHQSQADAPETEAAEPRQSRVSEVAAAAASHVGDAAGSVRDRFASVSPTGGKVIALGAIIVAVIVIVAFLGTIGTSWLSPFAKPDENTPVVQPPSDGSIEPIQTEEEEQEEASALPEDAPEVKSALADYSWDELSKISALLADAESDEAAIELAASYNLCGTDGSLDGSQTKSVELSDGTEVTMRLAGIRQDQRSEGAGVAGLTFIAENPVADRVMDPNGEVALGWQDASLRAWMNEDLLAELPEDLAGLVVAVDKTTNAAPATGESGQVVTSDKLWVPSYSELIGTVGEGGRHYGSYEQEGAQYRLFADMGINWYDGGEKVALENYWWLRSPDVVNSSWVMCVSPDGITSYGMRPFNENSVLMGFCL